MVERVRWQLEAWAQHETLTAGVTLLRLDPVEVRSDDGVQLGLWGGRTQADEWAVRAVARMVAVAGEQQVLVPTAQGGRHPHEMFEWVSAVTTDLLEPTERLTVSNAPWPGRLPSPSPAIVHASPQAITVTDATGRAVRVTGRGFVSAPPVAVQGEQLQAWAGPWPIEERWWDIARSRRMARFQVLTCSGRLLLLAVERGQWWLTAEYA
jgi:protein ImuB